MQEATQKYRKLTDYRTKCCYLCLLFSLLIAICASFAFLNGMVFSVLGHSFERHKWSFLLYIVSCSALKISFSITACIKNHTYFMSYFIIFCTNLSQVVLRQFYTERFSCIKAVLHGTICMISVTLCLISSCLIFFNSEKKELIRSFKNCIIHISMQKFATISQFTRSDELNHTNRSM